MTWDSLPALVIGYGNECRGDDGIGPAVARRIAALDLPETQVITVQQLLPELAQTISTVERVVFIDASREIGSDVRVCELAEACGDLLSSHSLLPGTLLAMSRLLYGRTPPAWLITIEGASFLPGDSLSPAVLRRAERATAELKDILHAQNSIERTL